MAMCIFFLGAPSIAQEGTASLSGRVDDITGKGLAGTLANLHSERSPANRSRVVADDSGMYRFPALLEGDYTLDLEQAGFSRLVVKEIHASEGEQKMMPTLRMDIGMGCSPHAVVEYLRLEKVHGSLVGTIRIDRGPLHNNGALIGSATVSLICGKGTICGGTITNSQGEFKFHDLSPGSYAIRASHAGFYPLVEPGYEVREGLESTYYPIYLERCSLGNCDPRLRPKKPPARCE
jgi:hypothetical protein